jgi:glycerol-3-phosphate acyltransferase PlsY
MQYLLSSFIGYFLGSIPTAYIFLKKAKGIDITKEGSGNVGAMNSFEISNSKLIGISVFLIDFVKGIVSVVIPLLIYPGEFIFPALALMFAVFSHCFNPWINFKGGRGLATAAGGAAIIFPFLLVLWALLWVIFYMMRKDILIANISSTIFSLLVVFGIPEIAIKYTYFKPESVSVLILVSASVLILIFIRHIEPLREIISNQKNNWKIKK